MLSINLNFHQQLHILQYALDNFIIIIGGFGFNISRSNNETLLSTRVIWKYNICTEEWRKLIIPKEREAPDRFYCAVAVAIEGTIYTFGGSYTARSESNALWTLSKAKRGSLTWSCIKTHCKEESPSPRSGHTGWEYAGKLWVFGGIGPSPNGYLNWHGDVTQDMFNDAAGNNQLLSYYPSQREWTNPQCFGTIPTPRFSAASAIMRKKVFLFGGCTNNQVWVNDFFQLDMQSLTWTQLRIGHISPQARSACTLTAISDNQLFLHGGHTQIGGSSDDTWIMDLTLCSWRLYTSRRDHHRQIHTATSGLNNNIIIIGGCKGQCDNNVYHNVFYAMLEPKRLQDLASRTVYKHQADLSWKHLPKKLITKLGFMG